MKAESMAAPLGVKRVWDSRNVEWMGEEWLRISRDGWDHWWVLLKDWKHRSDIFKAAIAKWLLRYFWEGWIWDDTESGDSTVTVISVTMAVGMVVPFFKKRIQKSNKLFSGRGQV